MIQESLMNFKDSIEKSGEMQLDFLLCQMLHKTPYEIQQMEAKGELTYEQKCFLQAGILWALENGIGRGLF